VYRQTATVPGTALAMTVAAQTQPRDADDFWVDIDHALRRIKILGDLDLSTYRLMVDAVDSLMATTPADVTLDLQGVTFIDAGTFGALVGICTHQHAQRVALHIIANETVERMAELCGLTLLITGRAT
jgi:anti-anti-sigma factor